MPISRLSLLLWRRGKREGFLEEKLPSRNYPSDTRRSRKDFFEGNGGGGAWAKENTSSVPIYFASCKRLDDIHVSSPPFPPKNVHDFFGRCPRLSSFVSSFIPILLLLLPPRRFLARPLGDKRTIRRQER